MERTFSFQVFESICEISQEAADKFLSLAHDVSLPQHRKLYTIVNLEDYAQALKLNNSFMHLLSNRLSFEGCVLISADDVAKLEPVVHNQLESIIFFLVLACCF